MKTFDIVVSLNNSNNPMESITVAPHDNYENSYPTYFQLLKYGKPFAEIRLNDELKWEVCKGTDLSADDIQLIMEQIEAHVYKHAPQEALISAEAAETKKTHSTNWFDKIINSFSWKKSAA